MTDDGEGRAPTSADDCQEALALSLKALSVLRHDVRNLLASVVIVAERMERSEDARLVSAAPMLVASMERTVALGVKAGELVEAAGGEVLPVNVEAAARRAGGTEPLTIDVADGLQVLADQAHVEKILAEVISNSRHNGAAPSLSAQAAGGRVRVFIADDGPGIPDYATDTLFTPFKGAKRREGTGLGLPLAAKLAALNGGSLHLEKTGADGTVLVLELPQA